MYSNLRHNNRDLYPKNLFEKVAWLTKANFVSYLPEQSIQILEINSNPGTKKCQN